MDDPIVYIDRSRIREGQLGQVRRQIDDLVGFIDEREPQLLYYGFFLDEDAHRMTVVAVHPDPRSLELHLEVGGEAFREFRELIDLERIEVYGEPTDTVLDHLEHKARDLGGGGSVTVRSLHAGFDRMSDIPVR